ncbi:unnamed protein product [Lepidochelys olivacea]
MVMSGDGNPAGNFLQGSGSQCCSPAPHLGPLQPSLDPQLCPVQYSFLIGEDDRVYEGRGWSTMGAHAKNWNNKSLGISFLGSLSKTAPDNTTLTVAKSLIQCAVFGGFLSESYTLKGHRDIKSTECPGDALYEAISQWPEFEA